MNKMNRYTFGIIYLLVFTIIGCASSKNIVKNEEIQISKLVFRFYHSISEEGERNAQIVKDSLVAHIQKVPGYDPVGLEIMKQSLFTDMVKKNPEKEIHIELNQDTIWRYSATSGKIKGNLYRVDIEKGILVHYYSKNDKTVYYQTNLFDEYGDYEIQVFPNDVKELLGYTCHKVIIRKKEQLGEVLPISLGDSIFEMYVTDKIDLPIHALLSIGMTKNHSIYFPLEVRRWEEKLAGYQEVYEIKEIN